MNQSHLVWLHEHKRTQIPPLEISEALDGDVSMEHESNFLHPLSKSRSRSQTNKKQQQKPQQKPSKPRQIKTKSLGLSQPSLSVSRSVPLSLSSPPTPSFSPLRTPSSSLSPSSSFGDLSLFPSPTASASSNNNTPRFSDQRSNREAPASAGPSVSPKRKKSKLLPGVYTLPFEQYPPTHPGPPILSAANEINATNRVGLVLTPSLRHRFYVWELFSSPPCWSPVPLYFADEEYLTLYAPQYAEIEGRTLTAQRLWIGDVRIDAGRRIRGLVSFSVYCDDPGLQSVSAVRRHSKPDEAAVVKRVSHFRADVFLEYGPLADDEDEESAAVPAVRLRTPFYWIRAKWHDYIGAKPFADLHFCGPLRCNDYLPSQLNERAIAVYNLPEFRLLRDTQPGKRRKRKTPRSASYSEFSFKLSPSASPSSMSIGSPCSAPLPALMLGTPSSSSSPTHLALPLTPLRLGDARVTEGPSYLQSHSQDQQTDAYCATTARRLFSADRESNVFSDRITVRSNSPIVPPALPISTCPPASSRSPILPRSSFVSWDGNANVQGSFIELRMANHWPLYAEAPESEHKEQMRARFSAELTVPLAPAMLTSSIFGRRSSIPLEIYFAAEDSRIMQVRMTRRTLLGHLGSEYSFFESPMYPVYTQLSLEFVFQFNSDFIGAVPVSVDVFLPSSDSAPSANPATTTDSLFHCLTPPMPTALNEQIAEGSNVNGFLVPTQFPFDLPSQ